MSSISIRYSKQDRIALAGSVAFSCAALIQLLQVNPLSAALWVSIYASSVGIPFGVVALLMEAESKNLTGQQLFCWSVAVLSTLVGTAAIFWHFSVWAAITVVACFILANVLDDFHRAKQDGKKEPSASARE